MTNITLVIENTFTVCIYLFFQVNIKSLEDVVRAYLKLAEEKTETAKEESQQMVLDIEDLDNIQTPER